MTRRRSISVYCLRDLLRLCLFSALYASASRNLSGQVVIGKGSGQMPWKIEADWYLDTLNTIAWKQLEGKWQKVAYGIDDIFLCHGRIHLSSNSDQESSILYNYDLDGGRYEKCFCGDSIEIVWSASFVSMYNYKGELIRALRKFGTEPETPSLVQGVPSICIPMQNIFPYQTYHPKDIHGWGMFGTNGKWLIEPIYDSPFHFQNGTAEVLYYGQKRKINEKGEVVE